MRSKQQICKKKKKRYSQVSSARQREEVEFSVRWQWFNAFLVVLHFKIQSMGISGDTGWFSGL